MAVGVRSSLQLAILAFVACVLALDNGVARTPPMGWNSWNHWGCNINQTIIVETAKAMSVNGMRAAGYEFVNVDDCWQIGRYPNGTIMADPTTFPNGIQWLAEQVHRLGMKFGIYTCAGNYTCQGRPGSRGYECLDADTYAAWGVDYVKEDWCYTDGMDPRVAYSTMRDCLNSTGRHMVFSLCDWGVDDVWTWGNQTGNSWRDTGDISDYWDSMLVNFDRTIKLSAYASPGGWNDPDMLEVGNGGMTDDEYRSHFSLWAMMAAPLIAGNDPIVMDEATSQIYLATEVIAVDQDPLGIAADIVYWDRLSDQEVLARPLADGSWAVLLLNRGASNQSISVEWGQIDPSLAGETAVVRDLWIRRVVGEFTNSYTAFLEKHAVAVIKATFNSTGLFDAPDDQLKADDLSLPLTLQLDD